MRRIGGYALAAGIVVCAALTSLDSGCRTGGPSDESAGAELRFHNWWNYYEHGLARQAAGDTAAARRDFEISLGLQPGAKYECDQDMWRARTYGLHFIEGYFPNRELGICLYQQGETAEALRYIQKSLRQAPSGRAKHYLNLARQKQLAGKKIAAPDISLSAQGGERVWTHERSRVLTGTARGAGFIRQVVVNGRPEFIELAEESIPFSRTIPLKAGTNAITVEATDLLGQKSVRRVTCILDSRPPELLLRKLEKKGGEWVVEGVCLDDSGLASVVLDGARVFAGDGQVAPRSLRVEARITAARPLSFMAEDLAGNQLRTILSADMLAQEMTSARLAGGELAFASAGARDGAADAGPMLLCQASAAAPAEDRLKPSLQLKNVKPVTEVFDEEFFLDGNARDGGGLRSISISGEEMLPKEGQGALQSYFARRLPLDMGTNRFTIAAQDMAGNRTEQAITVIRRSPEYLDDEFRLTIGVPPLVSKARESIADQVKRYMEQELLREPVRFHLLERNEGWDYILREQRLSVSDLADPSAALRIGKLLPAELLLMASLLPEGAGLTVFAKVVETGTGRVVLTDDVYSESAEQDVSAPVAGLIEKLERRFPLVSGEIVEISGSQATISLGASQGINTGARFVVIRKAGEGEMRSGQVCKAGERFVELNVVRVKKDTGAAEILPATGRESIKGGDYVYAR